MNYDLEDIHRFVLSNSPDTVIVTDDRGAVTYVSPNSTSVLGFSPEEIRDLGGVHELFGTVPIPGPAEEGRTLNREYGVVDPSGKRRRILVAAKTISHGPGRILYSCRDITGLRVDLVTGAETDEDETYVSHAMPHAMRETVIYQDREGRIIWAYRVSGHWPEEWQEPVQGGLCYELWHKRDSRCPGCPVEKAFESGMPAEGLIDTPDGVTWDIKACPVKDDEGQVVGVVEVSRDWTEQERIQRTLVESERKYHALFEDSPISLWEEDFSLVRRYVEDLKAGGVENLAEYLDRSPDTVLRAAAMVRVHAVNEATVKMYGAPDKESVKACFGDIVSPEGEAVFKEQLLAIAEGRREFEAETVNHKLNGERMDVFLKWTVAPGFERTYGRVLVSVVDITRLKAAEDSIKVCLMEKDVLLREVHHRVKNNLAVIDSLLSLQARYVPGEEQRRLCEDVRARIRSIAVAHELVYRTEDLSDLNMAEYLGDLAEHLVSARRKMGVPVRLRTEIEPVSVGLDTAIPLGFILIEWVTNSLQHAFPPGEGGTVTVALRSLEEGELELSVSDDGVGLPDQVNPNDPGSLGFSLVKTLVKQIGGTTDLYRKDGTCVLVRFKETRLGR